MRASLLVRSACALAASARASLRLGLRRDAGRALGDDHRMGAGKIGGKQRRSAGHPKMKSHPPVPASEIVIRLRSDAKLPGDATSRHLAPSVGSARTRRGAQGARHVCLAGNGVAVASSPGAPWKVALIGVAALPGINLKQPTVRVYFPSKFSFESVAAYSQRSDWTAVQSKLQFRSWARAATACLPSLVMLVVDVLHPVHVLPTDHVGDCNMAHGVGRRGAVPVLHTRRRPDDITRLDLPLLSAFFLNPARPGSDYEEPGRRGGYARPGARR